MDTRERKYLEEVRDLLSSVNLKILALLKAETQETFVKETIINNGRGVDPGDSKHINLETWSLPMTGKYQWYKMSNQEGKIRKCENNGCNLFLKYNKDLQTYEHWKIDANNGKAFFVDKYCQESQ